MPWIEKRVGPAACPVGATTVYTAPSGTAIGTARGAKLTGTTFANGHGIAVGVGLFIGTNSNATAILPGGRSIPTITEKQFQWSKVLAPGEIIQLYATNASCSYTLVIKEFILEA